MGILDLLLLTRFSPNYYSSHTSLQIQQMILRIHIALSYSSFAFTNPRSHLKQYTDSQYCNSKNCVLDPGTSFPVGYLASVYSGQLTFVYSYQALEFWRQLIPVCSATLSCDIFSHVPELSLGDPTRVNLNNKSRKCTGEVSRTVWVASCFSLYTSVRKNDRHRMIPFLSSSSAPIPN